MKMKRTCRKGLSILLTLCMVLTLIPVVTPHAQATFDTPTRTTVLDLSSDNISYNGGSGDPTSEDISATAEGWSWEYQTNTLRLNGLNLQTADVYAIQLPEDSIIVLTDGSENIVSVTGSDEYGACGIYGLGNVTVVGNTGTLTVTSPDCESGESSAFYVDGGLTVQGGHLNVQSGEAETCSWGIYAYGSLLIDGGSVVVSSGIAETSSAIYSDESICIAGGSVSATAGAAYNLSTAIESYSVTFTGGTTFAKSGSSGSTYSVLSYSGIVSTGMTVLQADSASQYTLEVAEEEDDSGESYYYVYNDGANIATDLLIALYVDAAVSDQTVSGTVGTPLSDTNTVDITLTGLTFEGLAVGEDVSDWFGSSLPDGLEAAVSAVTETTATLAFSGTPEAASSAVMSITISGGKLSTGENLTVTSNSEAKFSIAPPLPTRTDALNLVGDSVSYQNSEGTTTFNVDPRYTDITDSREGWAWHHETLTLVLDGLNLQATGPYAIQLPGGSNIVLADGSSNQVSATNSAWTIQTILTDGDLHVTGDTGSLSVTSSSTSASFSSCIYTDGNLTISGGTIRVESGDAPNESYGLCANDDLTISGGTVYAKSGTVSAGISVPIIAFRSINDEGMWIFQNVDGNYTEPTTLSCAPYYYYSLDDASIFATDIRVSPVTASFEGEGTLEDPYEISSAEELKEMSDLIFNYNNLFADKYYELTKDIVLNEALEDDPEQWNPIGGYLPFKGVFDGNGHTISGLYIDGDIGHAGLFAYIQKGKDGQGGIVRNVGLVGGSITSTENSGGIVGYNKGGTVENCYNTGSVSGANAGGIVGRNFNGHIQNCYNTGEISASDDECAAGGIAGHNFNGHIQDSYNTGTIAAAGNECAAGGIVGQNENAPVTIVNCYNTGSVTGNVSGSDKGYIGGIAGVNDGSSIKNCYSTGALVSITWGSHMYAGGIAGKNLDEPDNVIENAYYSGAQGVAFGTDSGCVSMQQDAMRATTFVALLNENATALKTTYPTISPWRAAAAGENGGYPVLGTAQTFTLTISGGGTGATASGSYAAGTAVPISAGTRDGYTFNGWTTNTNTDFYGTLATSADIDLVLEPNMFTTFTRTLAEPGLVTIGNSTFAANAALYSGPVYTAIDGNNGNPDNGTVTRLIGIFATSPTGAKGVKTLRLDGTMQQVANDSLIDANPNYQETIQSGEDYYNEHKNDVGFVDNGFWRTLSFVPLYSQIATERHADLSRTLTDPADRFRIIAWYDNANCTGTPIKVVRLMVQVDYTGSQTVEAAQPTVTAVTPNSGSAAGGTSVTITGTNFQGATTVQFGTNNATHFTIDSATQITATAPAGSAGIVNVTVTTPGGTSAAVTADQFTYTAAPSGGNGPTSTPDNSKTTDVLIDGKAMSAGTTKTETGADGRTVTTVTVNTKKLEDILASEGSGAVVTIPITNNADRAVGTLTGQMVKSMENKDATLVIQTDSSSYTLPASEINIDSISKQLGANVALADVTVSVSVSSPSNAMATIVENAGKDGGFTIVAPAVDFTITCTYGDKAVTVSLFNAYVERKIAIPDGVDPNKITTGVVVEPDGTVHHVPTRVTVIGSRYYAVINSLTNSTYSVVWNPVEFQDVANHWAKDAVNNMGARMVVTGVGNGNYNPDKAITRAEFAAIVVRALGLEPETGSSAFSDVAALEWYAGYIKTAAAYGIITGYNEKVFGPNDTITREQAMTMVARAMKITGLNANLTDSDANTLIGAYADGTTVSDYANAGVAACLKTEVVSGREGKTLAPLGKVTRAETAVMIERLLSHSNLI